MSSCPLGRRVDGVGLAPDLVSASRVASTALGVGASNLRQTAAPSLGRVQNEHVGRDCVADAADAANGSWAETEQSDADRPMWVVHVRFRLKSNEDWTEGSLKGGMSTLAGKTVRFFVLPFCPHSVRFVERRCFCSLSGVL